MNLQRYKLTIEYEGTAYCGWQKQPGQKSVQDTLEEAFKRLIGTKPEVVVAGRTDAGVHAKGQVAHVDLMNRYDQETIFRAINYHLKTEAISLLDVQAVDMDFHARFSATKRSYVYYILNRQPPATFQANTVWHVYQPLHLETMRAGASHLIGHHDFSSFRAAACQSNSPMKTLDRIDIKQEEVKVIACYFEAKSFLHHQVRNIMGTLKQVGTGKLSPDHIPEILAAKTRAAAGPTAPACGLFLLNVAYE